MEYIQLDNVNLVFAPHIKSIFKSFHYYCDIAFGQIANSYNDTTLKLPFLINKDFQLHVDSYLNLHANFKETGISNVYKSSNSTYQQELKKLNDYYNKDLDNCISFGLPLKLLLESFLLSYGGNDSHNVIDDYFLNKISEILIEEKIIYVNGRFSNKLTIINRKLFYDYFSNNSNVDTLVNKVLQEPIPIDIYIKIVHNYMNKSVDVQKAIRGLCLSTNRERLYHENRHNYFKQSFKTSNNEVTKLKTEIEKLKKSTKVVTKQVPTVTASSALSWT